MQQPVTIKPLYPLALLALAALVFVPRLLDLDTFVNIDGCLFWFERPLEFYRRLLSGDLAGTLVSGHPGVMVMIMTGFSLLVAGFAKFRSFTVYSHFTDLLFWAKFPIVLVTGTSILLSVRMLRLHIGSVLLALAAGLFLALDPAFLAHSRFLQLDATTSTFELLSVVWLGIYAATLRPRDAALSGGFAGLAMLTKAYAAALVPFAGLTILATHFWLERERSIRTPAARLGIWLGAACGTFVALWPAMWVAPLSTIEHLTGRAIFMITHLHENLGPGNGLSQAVVGHALKTDLSFKGRLITELFGSDTLLPLVLALVPIGFLAAGKIADPKIRRMTAATLGFALFFGIGMSFFGKTSPRYLIVICMLADVLAGIGVYLLFEVTKTWSRPALKLASAAVLAAAVVATGVSVFAVHPYYATYENHVFDPHYNGWGEGLDMVADYFAEKPNVADLKIASFYPCILVKLGGCNAIGLEEIDDKNPPDYVVLYKSQVEREMYPDVIQAYIGDPERKPEFVAKIRGVEYAWVYKARAQAAAGAPATASR